MREGSRTAASARPASRFALSAVAFITAACCLILGASCSSFGSGSNDLQSKEREKLTVYLWSVDLLSEYAPYVESQVPDVDIEWIVGNNDLDFYKFMQQNDELPDIITTRRFSVNDAAELQPYLLDLSETEIAATFYPIYLDAYRNADGSVNWLPACGEVDGFIANKRLFERYDIPLPTDYSSFVAACQEFAKHDIQGFMSDFVYDYTCMEVLQGSSIPLLQTLEGRLWRLDYENGAIDGLDDEIWPEAFKRFERFIRDTGLTADDSTTNYGKWRNAFVNEQAAIVRGTGVDIGALTTTDNMDVAFLPYFGETENDNWVLTYPSFQAAVSKKVEESSSRRNAALSVLEAMFSEGGQQRIAPNHSAIPYNRNVNLQLAGELDALIPYITSNHLYIRLASNEFFSASKEVVGKMLSGEYDATAAYEAFSALLEAPEVDPEKVCVLETAYPYEFDAEGGIPAASSVANTLRTTTGAEALLMPNYICTGGLEDAAYTQKALQFVIGPNSPGVFNIALTGDEITALARAMVEGAGDMILVPFSPETLPVASGIELHLSIGGGGYLLDSVTIGGNPLEPSRVYTVAFVDNLSHARLAYDAAFGEGASDDLPKDYSMARASWVNHILGGSQPDSATDYLFLSSNASESKAA